LIDFTDGLGGTSSSCPLVAGIAALVLSANPALKSDEVKTILEKTARRIGPDHAYDADGHFTEFGYGCVDAEAAVERARAEAT